MGDGLPQLVCDHCWNIVSSMNELQTVSLKSERLLNDILNKSSSTPGNEADDIEGLKIEFIDTQSSVEKELLEQLETSSSSDDSIPLKPTLKTEPTVQSEVKPKTKLVRKKREKKISCEICGKLVASDTINFHLNVHKGDGVSII